MEKYTASEIEIAMLSKISGIDDRISLEESALKHLEQAHDILVAAGYNDYSNEISKIIFSYGTTR